MVEIERQAEETVLVWEAPGQDGGTGPPSAAVLRDAFAHLRANCNVFADRLYWATNVWNGLNYFLGTLAAIIAALAGASAFKDNANLAAWLACGAAVAGGINTFLKPAKRASDYLTAARDFRALERQAITSYWDVDWPAADAPAPRAAVKVLDELTSKMQKVNDTVPPVPGWTALAWRLTGGKSHDSEGHSLFDDIEPLLTKPGAEPTK